MCNLGPFSKLNAGRALISAAIWGLVATLIPRPLRNFWDVKTQNASWVFECVVTFSVLSVEFGVRVQSGVSVQYFPFPADHSISSGEGLGQDCWKCWKGSNFLCPGRTRVVGL